MLKVNKLKNQLAFDNSFAVRFLSFLVAAHGIYIVASGLLEQIAIRHSRMLSELSIDLPLIIGLGLIYLGSLLRRRKRTAWLVTIMAYTFYLGISLSQLISRSSPDDIVSHDWIRALVLPLTVLGLLLVFQKQFVVKSDIQGFHFAARFSVIVVGVAFIYGVTGFLLLDKSDFHQEINFPTAVHYTVDQFDLTTARPLQPYTKRAHLFVDSLSLVSVAAIAYAALSLFQPLKIRLTDQQANRDRMLQLLERYGGPSEEFFKLWPHDKQYFFDESGDSGLAFHVKSGVALCLSDPAGNSRNYPRLLQDFQSLCFNNDWLPALIHVPDKNRKLYEKQGFLMQKLGEEAVVDIGHFRSSVANQKYFRQIRNKFERNHFTCELLEPPHHAAVLDRLKTISDDWLSRGGRAERGFAMGYYSNGYMQQCRILVARDAAGTIQAFLNLIPADFDKEEATFDMMRYTVKSLSNTNDFLLMNLIEVLAGQGYKRLNLGLCPLAGLEDPTEKNTLIHNFLRFAYANGDRFYSFSGLLRFKAKYEPEWRDRYVAYQGGVRGFSKTMTALMRTMRI